jgi:hypothetical protein
MTWALQSVNKRKKNISCCQRKSFQCSQHKQIIFLNFLVFPLFCPILCVCVFVYIEWPKILLSSKIHTIISQKFLYYVLNLQKSLEVGSTTYIARLATLLHSSTNWLAVYDWTFPSIRQNTLGYLTLRPLCIIVNSEICKWKKRYALREISVWRKQKCYKYKQPQADNVTNQGWSRSFSWYC